MKQASHKIVVVQYGWVLTGEVTATDKVLKIKNGSAIRRWGTTAGLGQLAISGKTSETTLDPFGDGEVPLSAVLYTIDCRAPL